jgi:hypothetical protein
MLSIAFGSFAAKKASRAASTVERAESVMVALVMKEVSQ